MELEYLCNIVNHVGSCFGLKRIPYEHELKREIVNLSYFEKRVLRNQVHEMDYNIGTLNVIKLLKECDVTTVSEYLSAVDSTEEKLLIITEIFDDRSSYELLEEIIDSNKFGDLVNLCVKNYINDLIHRQDIIENEIITTSENLLPPELFVRCMLPNFLANLFHFDLKNVKELSEIVSNQKDWNVEYSSFKVLRSVFEKILPNYNSFIAKEICNLIQNEKQICWFFILMAVGYVKEEYDGYVELKNLINLHVNAFCESNNINSLYKALILSRQMYHYSLETKKTSYQQWLKNNIGDINYKLKNRPSFSELIQLLENVIPYENDTDVIQLHISCQIPAPRKEYSRVMEYKDILRTRLDVLIQQDQKLTEIMLE